MTSYKKADIKLKMKDINRLFDNNLNDFINEHNWNNVAMEYKSIIEKYI